MGRRLLTIREKKVRVDTTVPYDVDYHVRRKGWSYNDLLLKGFEQKKKEESNK